MARKKHKIPNASGNILNYMVLNTQLSQTEVIDAMEKAFYEIENDIVMEEYSLEDKEQFKDSLKMLIEMYELSFDTVKWTIDIAFGNIRRGPTNRTAFGLRRFPRRLERSECQSFHRKFGPISPDLLDLAPNRSGLACVRISQSPSIRPDIKETQRGECEKFHGKKTEIPSAMKDRTGPQGRK